MREEIGDLFTYPCDALVVPCNWTTKRTGDAVMGAGVAKQAAERWPDLPAFLGTLIRGHVLAVHAIRQVPGPHIVCLPTKRDWRRPSRVDLIEAMVHQLVWFATEYEWEAVALPRLGCGERTGQLDWETQVRPLLSAILDDRFVVCHPSEGA